MSQAKEYAAPIHKDLIARWESILQRGLEKESRASLLVKYPPASNCVLAEAAKINPEIRSSTLESAITRDARLISLQTQIGACLSITGKALTLLLNKEGQVETVERQLIELLSDAGRLLADVHHSESISRRKLLGFGLNKKFKTTLEEAPLGEWLFGENLEVRLKTAKALERSSSELKASTSRPPAKQPIKKVLKPLNSYRPSHRQYKASRQDGQKYTYQRGRSMPSRPRSPYRKLQTKPRRRH